MLGRELLRATEDKPKYLLSAKFNQDPLELFFSKMRGCGGWNHHPTAQQFATNNIKLFAGGDAVKASRRGNCTVPREQM